MEASGYVTLTRQAGLLREMQVVANNVANSATTGFRREGVVFSEYVKQAGQAPSLSMALGETRHVDLTEGTLARTGGSFDFAIQGEGFFLVQTAEGQRLTRAGNFTPGPDGTLQTADGHSLLDAGGAPVVLPAGAGQVALATDGTLSAGDQPFSRIGLWLPDDPLTLRHEAGTLFSTGNVIPMQGGAVLQGMLEESNVEPVAEIARMIEVQRAYELGQGFLDREDERMRGMIRMMGG